jgi:predicted membrane protein
VNASPHPAAASPRLHLPSLAAALAIMIAGTLYPPLMADAAGRADHALAMVLFWAMSAGFVRGVGFVPRHPLLRALYSGWACALALALAAAIKWTH